MQPLRRGNIRLAATVLLLRDAVDDLEVFMLKRPGGIDFPDLHVFPGGKVDEADDIDPLCDGLNDAEASRLLGLDAGGIRYWVAAVRECFEECGVLLARRNGEILRLEDASERRRFDGYRALVTEGALGFVDMCRQESLTIACDRMMYYSHWLTPEVAPRRFDTRFFCAVMPAGQQALGHHWETVDSDWIAPVEALARHERGEWQMIHPTFTSLKSLLPFARADEAMAAVLAETHLPELTDKLRSEGMQDLR